METEFTLWKHVSYIPDFYSPISRKIDIWSLKCRVCTFVSEIELNFEEGVCNRISFYVVADQADCKFQKKLSCQEP